MSAKRPVVVYGASGYTGRLVCEFLRDQQIPFIAAGRDKARIEAALEKVPGIETADLIELCEGRLGSVKSPKSVDFVEELPRSPAGKVLKKTLRDRYWGDRERRI